MRYNFENFVSGLAFGSEGSFSCPVKFGAYCNSRLIELVGPIDSDIDNKTLLKLLIDKLPKCIEGNSSLILDMIVREDLKKIENLIDRIDPKLLLPSSVSETAESMKKIAGNLGFLVGDLNIRIVDDYPEPYSGAPFAAMSYDSVDNSDYGIDVGVALKSAELKPLYTQVLLGHEFAHFIIGQKPTQILARGLEEGIADYLGGIMIVGSIIGRGLAESVLIAMRRRFEQNQFWRIYRDGLLATSSLLLLRGEVEFSEMILMANREGRGVIKDFERKLLRGEISLSTTIDGNENSRSFAQRVISLTPENTLSPISFYVCRTAKVGERIEVLAERLSLSATDVTNALDDAQNKAFMAIPYAERVYSNEGAFYFRENSLRYVVGTQ